MHVKYFNDKIIKKICIIMFLPFAVMVFANDTAITQNKNAPNGFAFNDLAKYKDYPNLHGGIGTIKYIEGFGPKDFKTNYQFLRMGVIPPKSSIGEYRAVDSDELFIIMSGLVYVTVNGRTGRIVGGSLVPCSMGETIGIYNPTEWDVPFAWIATADHKWKYNPFDLGNDLSKKHCEIPCPFTWIPMDYGDFRSYTNSSAHEGQGLLFKTICNTGSYFRKNNTHWYASIIGIPPGASIGYHRHTIYEEIYFMVSGKARGTVDDVTLDLKIGDCIMCPRGSAHGIYNNSTEDVLIIFSRTILPGRKMKFTNLGDDLTKR